MSLRIRIRICADDELAQQQLLGPVESLQAFQKLPRPNAQLLVDGEAQLFSASHHLPRAQLGLLVERVTLTALGDVLVDLLHVRKKG